MKQSTKLFLTVVLCICFCLAMTMFTACSLLPTTSGESGENKPDPTACTHSYGEWTTVKQPTCTATGLREKTCALCNDKQTEVIAKTEHTPGELTEVYTATCNNSGATEIRCTVCNAVLEHNIVPALGHTAGDWVTVRESTCSVVGLRQKQCTVCHSVVESETLPLLSHVEGAWKVTKAAACGVVGHEETRCTVCNALMNERSIPALSHVAGEWTVYKQATCSAAGTERQCCTICKAVLQSRSIPVLEHTPGEWEVKREATCTALGYSELHCKSCNALIGQQTIPTLAHTEGDWVVSKQPTCSAEGQRTKSCTVCKTVLQTEKVDKVAHTLAWQVTTPATCTEDGVESNVCSVCKAVESTRTVSKLGGAHVAGEWQVTTQPTCSAEGVRKQYCKNCNVLLQTEAVAKAAHKYDNGNFTFKSSTDYSNPNGTWTYTCTVCKATKNESGTMARPGNSLYAFNRIATRQWYSGLYFTFNGNGSFSASVMVETAQKFYRDLFVLCEKFLDKTGDLDDDSKLGTIYTRYFTSSELEGKEFTNKDVGTFFYAMTEWFKSDMPYYYFFNNYKYSYGSSTSGSSKRFSYTVQYVAGYKTESWRTRAINGIDKMIEDYTGYYENLYPDERLRAKAIYDKTAALIKYQDGGASSNSLACAVTGTGVCEGYALTFEFLCRLNGIEAHMCYCTEHAWNVAKVKGYWYVFDATWGDTSTNMAKYFGTLKHVEKEPKTRWFFDPSITFGSPSQLKLSYS